MKKQIISEEFRRMQKLAGIQLTEAVEVPTWLKGKLEDVHTKPGQGSIFAKSIDDVLKLAQNALDKSQDIDKIANGTGTLTVKSPGIGYNLVLPIDKAKALPGAKESEVEKQEGPNKVKVSAITTTAPLTQFKSDELTVIVRPKKDEAGAVLPNEYIVLSAFPGDPSIPKASEWGGKYAVIIPGGKEEVKEINIENLVNEALSKHRKLNESIMQKAVDFIKDPSGKKRATAAAADAEKELDKSNRASAEAAEKTKRKAELDAKEKEYRSKLSPDQLKQLEDYEDAEYRHHAMTGGSGDYGSYYHNQKNKWDKLAEKVTEVLKQHRRILKENEAIKEKVYDYLTSNEIKQETGVTSFTTCDEDDWEKVKKYIEGNPNNRFSSSGKQSFLANNEDVTEQDFDKYYDEWLDYIEDERNMESRNQQDFNF